MTRAGAIIPCVNLVKDGTSGGQMHAAGRGDGGQVLGTGNGAQSDKTDGQRHQRSR